MAAIRTTTRPQNDYYVSTLEQLVDTMPVDNVTRETRAYDMIAKGKWGLRNRGGGGTDLVIPLQYDFNRSVQSMGYDDPVPEGRYESTTSATYQFKLVAGTVTKRFEEVAANVGKERVFNLIEQKLQELEYGFRYRHEVFAFGDGTGNGGTDPNGLATFISTDPTTGTVGGINRATYSWWRNQVLDFSGESFHNSFRRKCLRMMNDCSRGQGSARPDAILGHQYVHESYIMTLDEQQKVSLKPVDGALPEDILLFGVNFRYSDECPEGYLYFLSTRHLGYCKDPNNWMLRFPWERINNTLNEKMIVVCREQMVCSNCSSQGLIYGIDPDN